MSHHCPTRLTSNTRITHTPTGYFHLLKWKETNNSALAHARTQKHLHTQRYLDYFGRPWVYYFVLWGWEVGEVVLRHSLWYGGSVCELVRKEAPVRSIHPLRRFPAECDVRMGKWAGPRILCLLWIWHELGPRPLRMWWMYYLIFLSLLTSFWPKAQWFSLCEWMKQHLQFGLWILMKYNNGHNNREPSTRTFPTADTLMRAELYFRHTWVHCTTEI